MAATPFLYLCALTGNHQNDKDIGKVTPCQRHQLINGNSFDQLVAKLKKILFANFLTNIFFSDSLLIPFYIHNKLYCHIFPIYIISAPLWTQSYGKRDNTPRVPSLSNFAR